MYNMDMETIWTHVLVKNNFKKIDVPLTGVPEITWYVKDSFAIGDRPNNCLFFVYGKLIYGSDGSVIDMHRKTLISSAYKYPGMTIAVHQNTDQVARLIEALPNDLALCLDIHWAGPLVEAFFKDWKSK